MLSLLLFACVVDAPTYEADVAPLLQTRCAGCHTEGGIAPMRLDSYDAAAPLAGAIAAATAARTMPPWGADADLVPLADDPSLSDDELDVLQRWADAGAPEGEPTGETIVPAALPGLSRVDLELSPAMPYTPTARPDEYRCFVVDWPEDEVRYVTGFNAVPGAEAVVHHVVAFVVQADQAELVHGFDDAEPGEGYGCFGGPTPEGYDDDPANEALRTGFFGQWAPGTQGHDFPAGTGIRANPGAVVVLQVHYNLPSDVEIPDQSRVQLKLDDTVDEEGWYMPWFDITWAVAADQMRIPAGEADVHHRYDDEPGTSVNMLYASGSMDFANGLYAHAVFPHMHRLGRSLTLDQGGEPVFRMSRWDFNWQLEYAFEEPLELTPGVDLGIDCGWDNTAEARAERGVTGDPVDVYWGEGTTDEMCLAFLYVTAR